MQTECCKLEANWQRTRILRILSSISVHNWLPPGIQPVRRPTSHGEIKTMENIHVAKMKKGHSLDLMSGERSGNITAPNRSTAIRIRFWMETTKETLPKKGRSLHKAWPSWLPIRNELACKSDNLKGIENTGNNKSDEAMFAKKKMIVFFKFGVLQTVIAMRQFAPQWNDDDQTVGNGSSDFQRRKI